MSAITTQWIAVDSAAGRFGAYLALPPAGRGPGLLLLQEIFGVNPHIRGVVEQYALDGFVVLAPDLFWRDAPRVELAYEGADRAHAQALLQTMRPDTALADMRASLAALRARPECAGKVGAIGYCLGGRLAYNAAALADIDAAVAYYGGGIQRQLDLAPQVKCPMQFHYAGHDEHISRADVDAVQAAMQGKTAEFHWYENAQHGFNCWARSSYHPASAALAHARSLGFLTQLFD